MRAEIEDFPRETHAFFKKEILGKKCRFYHPTKGSYESGHIASTPYKISGHLKIKIRNVAGFVPLGDVQVDDG